MERTYDHQDLEQAIRRTAPGGPPEPDFAAWREKHADIVAGLESCLGAKANHDRFLPSVLRFGSTIMKNQKEKIRRRRRGGHRSGDGFDRPWDQQGLVGRADHRRHETDRKPAHHRQECLPGETGQFRLLGPPSGHRLERLETALPVRLREKDHLSWSRATPYMPTRRWRTSSAFWTAPRSKICSTGTKGPIQPVADRQAAGDSQAGRPRLGADDRDRPEHGQGTDRRHLQPSDVQHLRPLRRGPGEQAGPPGETLEEPAARGRARVRRPDDRLQPRDPRRALRIPGPAGGNRSGSKPCSTGPSNCSTRTGSTPKPSSCIGRSTTPIPRSASGKRP